GFVIASARTARRAPAMATPAASIVPIATVKQIMTAIVGPGADTIFKAVGSTMTANGEVEVAPHTDEEWDALGSTAAALIESGNLMLMGSRVVDQRDWVNMTRAMMEAAKVTLSATRAKSADKVLESGEALNDSCDNCHSKYRRTS